MDDGPFRRAQMKTARDRKSVSAFRERLRRLVTAFAEFSARVFPATAVRRSCETRVRMPQRERLLAVSDRRPKHELRAAPEGTGGAFPGVSRPDVRGQLPEGPSVPAAPDDRRDS